MSNLSDSYEKMALKRRFKALYDSFSIQFNLTLPMLRLLSSKTQERKDFWKPSKPCWYSLDSSHWVPSLSTLRWVPICNRFQLFSFGQISHQQHKGYQVCNIKCNHYKGIGVKHLSFYIPSDIFTLISLLWYPYCANHMSWACIF